MERPTVACVVGTRPEAIKLAPVILRLRQAPAWCRCLIVATGQHPELARLALGTFGLSPDVELAAAGSGGGLGQRSAACLAGLSEALGRLGPELVVVQGDTTSAWAGALAASFLGIPVAHVEAGLRSGDLREPYPEELHRRLISRVACVHFAPTPAARSNLVAEGVPARSIRVTGNTVVDALELVRPQVESAWPVSWLPGERKLVLVTAHRRENLGGPLRAICRAVAWLAAEFPELHFVFARHPNPQASAAVRGSLAAVPGVTLAPPLPYVQALGLLAACWLVLTDSGGLQEEAPSFGRPVLVLRNRTERTEGLRSGFARLVGTDPHRIADQVAWLLRDRAAYERMCPAANPYGDGRAAGRIADDIGRLLHGRGHPVARQRLGLAVPFTFPAVAANSHYS